MNKCCRREEKKEVNVSQTVCKVSNIVDDQRLLRHAVLCPDILDFYQVIPFQIEEPYKEYTLSLKRI